MDQNHKDVQHRCSRGPASPALAWRRRRTRSDACTCAFRRTSLQKSYTISLKVQHNNKRVDSCSRAGACEFTCAAADTYIARFLAPHGARKVEQCPDTINPHAAQACTSSRGWPQTPASCSFCPRRWPQCGSLFDARFSHRCALRCSAGAYKFTRVVADTYIVQFLAPDGGPNAEMRFARKGSAATSSNASPSTGQTSAFTLASGTATLNALIQVLPVRRKHWMSSSRKCLRPAAIRRRARCRQAPLPFDALIQVQYKGLGFRILTYQDSPTMIDQPPKAALYHAHIGHLQRPHPGGQGKGGG